MSMPTGLYVSSECHSPAWNRIAVLVYSWMGRAYCAFTTTIFLQSSQFQLKSQYLSSPLQSIPSNCCSEKVVSGFKNGTAGIGEKETGVQCRESPWMHAGHRPVKRNALNVGTGSSDYEGRQENDNQNFSVSRTPNDISSQSEKSPNRILYLLSIALVLCGCALVFSLIAFVKKPSSLLAAIAKSGFTAAFSLIFVSEIGDKTFFIAALLAMQYEKLLVLLGSMRALSLMIVLSVVIGRIFHSVPAQFQTTLLMFFGLKSIKNAWDLPSTVAKTGDQGSDEFVEAEELVKENVSKPLSNPLEVVWKSFSLVFFAEWGDRSMLAMIALGAAQVGYFGGALFLGFAVATFFGVF